MKVNIREKLIEEFEYPSDKYFDRTTIHICSRANDWRCDLRLYVDDRILLFECECDNELRLEDVLLKREDE